MPLLEFLREAWLHAQSSTDDPCGFMVGVIAGLIWMQVRRPDEEDSE